jgi:hypothetical protein
MNEHEEMRAALGTLLARPESYPLDLSGTHLLVAGRARRRRRRVLTAATVAILAAAPVTAFALVSASPQMQTGQRDGELRLVPPEPCVTGDEAAGLPQSQVDLIRGELRTVMADHRDGLALPALTSASGLALDCGPRSTTRGAITALTDEPRPINVSITVGTQPVADDLVTNVRLAGGISYGRHYDPLTTTYQVTAGYGPYCILRITGIPPKASMSFPFRNEVELHAFLLDPRILDLARRLAG